MTPNLEYHTQNVLVITVRVQIITNIVQGNLSEHIILVIQFDAFVNRNNPKYNNNKSLIIIIKA